MNVKILLFYEVVPQVAFMIVSYSDFLELNLFNDTCDLFSCEFLWRQLHSIKNIQTSINVFFTLICMIE